MTALEPLPDHTHITKTLPIYAELLDPSKNSSKTKTKSPAIFKRCLSYKARPIGEVVRDIILTSNRFYSPQPFKRKQYTSHGTRIVYPGYPEQFDEESSPVKGKKRNKSFLWNSLLSSGEADNIEDFETNIENQISESPRISNVAQSVQEFNQVPPSQFDESKEMCTENSKYYNQMKTDLNGNPDFDQDVVFHSSENVSNDISFANLLLVSNQERVLTDSMYAVCPELCQLEFDIPLDDKLACSKFIHWEKCWYQMPCKSFPKKSPSIGSDSVQVTQSETDIHLKLKKKSMKSRESTLESESNRFASSENISPVCDSSLVKSNKYFSALVFGSDEPHSNSNSNTPSSSFGSVSLDTLALGDSQVRFFWVYFYWCLLGL